MNHEYASTLIYMSSSLILAMVLLWASYVLAVQQGDPEKMSAYECGFNPFSDARHNI
jgi:NADH-quinone oxidoreductase subunit A